MTAQEVHPLFGAAPQKHWPVLASVSRHLLEGSLPQEHPWRKPATGFLTAQVGQIDHIEDIATALDTVMSELTNRHIITTVPLAAFLAARAPADPFGADLEKNKACRSIGNYLSASILAAALLRLQETPEQNAIWQGVRHARLLKTKAPRELIRLKSVLRSVDPVIVCKALDVAKDETGLSHAVSGYFQSLATLMRSAIEGKIVIHAVRDADQSGSGVRDYLPLEAIGYLGDVQQIVGGVIPENSGFAGPDDLQVADFSWSWVAIQGNDDSGNDDSGHVVPRKLAQKKVGKAAKAAARRDLSLACEMDSLTKHEVCVLVDWMRHNLSDPACRMLLGDLVFGPAHFDGACFASDIKSRLLGLVLSVNLPDFEGLVEGEDDYSIGEHLFLPAPSGLCNPAREVETSAALRNALGGLRDQLARPLTRGRIVRFKADWLRQQGTDPAIIGFLVGQSPANRAQMHYSCVDQDTLIELHERYLKKGLGMSLKDWSCLKGKGLYGSRQRLPKDLLRLVFKEARKDVKRLKVSGLGSFSAIVEAHNSFMIYSVLVLYFATGHRPVSHPFEFRGDFDLEAGLLWISDKTGRGARGTRLVPLCELACIQVEEWIAHLEKLQVRLNWTHPELAVKVGEALCVQENAQKQAPFFFLLDASGTFQPLHPSLQEEVVKPILPAALNWTRHTLRSALLGVCEPALLDAFLGHGHIAEEPFVSGSSLSFAGLFDVADKIQGLMARYGVRSLESPL